ncbi:hypothetical protein MLD38_037257 [Melastoma candidum]|uniref:Uncharacterized protein n=1 Tax=Melastoma candidum TaxID=119954 RepID=A0ACB9LMI2_9MYRT|nr:hypothetical protein MLD38_037257 [Melastoma candidum]
MYVAHECDVGPEVFVNVAACNVVEIELEIIQHPRNMQLAVDPLPLHDLDGRLVVDNAHVEHVPIPKLMTFRS